MCRAVLESGEDQSAAEGINDGIMFLMAVPYILVAIIGYFVSRTYYKSQQNRRDTVTILFLNSLISVVFVSNS